MIHNEEIEGKRIALLLSGGVDSAVALHLLCELGQKPDCFYIKIGAPGGDCTMEEDMEMATSVAHKYGCRLEMVDCHREYWDQVTGYTMEKVRAGLTPNPDVMCNRLIKFGAFNEKRGHEYDLIATGHYAQTAKASTAPLSSPQKGGSPDAAELPLLLEGVGGRLLCTSPDPVKDQTDFLAQLYWWQLQKALFPIGHLMKDEVRQIAEREHLVNAKRKDSQGICFLGKINYNDYIRQYLGELPGDVVELETGRKIGRHKGLWFHTIGQRHGLGFGGGPWFAVKKDMATNTLYVSHGYDPQTAYKQDFKVKGMNWLAPFYPTPAGTAITFKIRHTPEFHKGMIRHLGDGSDDPIFDENGITQNRPLEEFCIHSEEPIHGVAPGQFCVLYDAEHYCCLGSGEITI